MGKLGIGAAVAVTLLAGGCSGTGPDDERPTRTSETTPDSGSSPVQPSTGKDPTTEDGYAGADAAIEEFVRAQLALDEERMRAVSAPGCGECRQRIEEVREARKDGLERLEMEGEPEISVAWDWGFGSDAAADIAYVELRTPQTRVVAGADSTTAPAQRMFAQAGVVREGDRWLVASMGEMRPAGESEAATATDVAATSATDPGYSPEGLVEVTLPALREQELPDELSAHDAQGAMSAAAYVGNLLQTRSLVLPDQAAALTPECASCTSSVAYLQELDRSGYRLEADTTAYTGDVGQLVRNVSPHQGATDDESVWTITLDTPFTSVVDESGQVVTTWPMDRLAMEVSLYWDDEATLWRVRDISEAEATP